MACAGTAIPAARVAGIAFVGWALRPVNPNAEKCRLAALWGIWS
jgi:hypothetical protein